MPKVVAPYHGAMGPRHCISLSHVLRDTVEETLYHNNKHVKTIRPSISFTSHLNKSSHILVPCPGYCVSETGRWYHRIVFNINKQGPETKLYALNTNPAKA